MASNFSFKTVGVLLVFCLPHWMLGKLYGIGKVLLTALNTRCIARAPRIHSLGILLDGKNSSRAVSSLISFAVCIVERAVLHIMENINPV
ncbi:hypothetical protein Csa_011779 [Cucumis sativus]|uniref:Uncharacterized protein n=1 Tax=Cucumis sativus TaxID=3659 RepID=A0A0A0L5J5_CUCSA|nr:hypothetical protein Csa_011779 [Cucumis sativus]